MKYDPIMCMMVDDSVKTKDAMFVQLKFSSGRTEGAKLEESEYREYAEALLNKYGEKMVTISKNGKVIATYMNRGKLFNDSNAIDKAIKSCDANWTEAYKEMENVMNKFSMQGISTSIIYDRVKELYMKHKGDPAWETAWQKLNQ